MGAASVAGLLAVEILLRLFGLSYPSLGSPDPVLGWSPRPGAQAFYRWEGEAHVSMNSAGYRDRERAVDKPDGTLRIAILGDSVSEAVQVPVETTWWSRLERQLNQCEAMAGSGKVVEVLNFSVSGYSTAQEYLTLKHRVAPYSPDLVLLQVFTGNDITNNLRSLDGDSMKPHFTVAADGSLELDDSFRYSAAYRHRQRIDPILRYSRTGQLLKHVYRVLQSRRRNETRAAVQYEVPAEVYQPPQSSEWREAWRITERLFQAIAEEATRQGGRLAIVTVTNSLQVYPGAERREELFASIQVTDPFYPDRRIADFGAREGIPVLNLAPPMQAQADATGVFMHGHANASKDSGHWNANGHEAAARLISDWLCEWLPSTPRS